MMMARDIFSAAHYTLWILLCTHLEAIIMGIKKQPKVCVMSNIKLCLLSTSKHILEEQMSSQVIKRSKQYFCTFVHALRTHCLV
jgi:hypothetical protein